MADLSTFRAKHGAKVPADLAAGEKTLHILVKGIVQGVFFRKFVKENAQTLGITGFTRNMADGSVEAICHGSDEALEKLLANLKVGPPAAKVDKIIFKKITTKQKFDSFEIRP